MAKLISVLVRDRKKETLLKLTNQQTLIVLGALGADPDSFEELESAVLRYLTPEAEVEFFGPQTVTESTTNRCDGRPDYAIDLPGRLLTFDNDYPPPERHGHVRCETQQDNENPLAAHAPPVFAAEYHLSAEWEIVRASSQWRIHADGRRHRRDCWHRAGQELMREKFSSTIAQEICQDRYGGHHKKSNGKGKARIRLPKLAEQSSHLLCDDVLETESIRIHARWLLRARPELDGGTIREYLIGDVLHIEWDIACREEQWLVTGQQPLPRSIAAHAYHWGGIGPNEFYLRFRLAEYLVKEGLEWCNRSEDDPIRLDLLVSFLEKQMDHWLSNPVQDEFLGFSPIEIIHLERQRIPLTISDDANSEPCNCPLCELSGIEDAVTFWRIDDGWLPPDFLFSKYLTVESFLEVESWKFDQLTDKFGEDIETLKVGEGVEGHLPAGMSYTVTRLDPNSAEVAPFVLLFDLGAGLADLMDQLRTKHNESFDEAFWLEQNRVIRQIVQEDAGIVGLDEPIRRVEAELDRVQNMDVDLRIHCDAIRKCLSALARMHDADITTR